MATRTQTTAQTIDIRDTVKEQVVVTVVDTIKEITTITLVLRQDQEPTAPMTRFASPPSPIEQGQATARS